MARYIRYIRSASSSGYSSGGGRDRWAPAQVSRLLAV
jgi:hypothetical protein